jgi:hypothetical protein
MVQHILLLQISRGLLRKQKLLKDLQSKREHKHEDQTLDYQLDMALLCIIEQPTAHLTSNQYPRNVLLNKSLYLGTYELA